MTSKFSKVDETVDIAYNQESTRFDTSYKALKAVQKDLQKYFGLLKDIGIHHAELTASFVTLYENHQKMWATSKKNQEIQMMIDQHRTALEGQMNDDVFMPLSEYMGQFKIIDDRAKERNKRRVDMDRYRTEVKRLTEKPPKDPSKLPTAQRKYAAARQGYEALNQELLTDMAKLHEDRLDFVDPVFATFVSVQNSYHSVCAQKLGELMSMVAHIDKSSIHSHTHVISEYSSADVNPYTNEGAVQTPQSTPAPSRQPASNITAAPTQTYQQPPQRGPMPTAPGGGGVVATALYPFQAQSPQELAFQYGDKITILKQEGDWWMGQLNGKTGLVPSNYVQIQ
eukprot:TRINITY_DN1315_c0_g1_i1.p1 TRINITY_DN1315_c0_g1~~TRINITY_DN1315_c0_g1_i1.p1  ORF type:complete len:381 (-),score=61.23 TRINITY_DN1315_c0_g1_i1:63-1082(-)